MRSRRALQPFDLLDEARQHVLALADDGDERRHVLADLGRVDVDVDDLRLRREGGELAGDAVVEARADGDQQVALVHRVVGGDGAVHAEHAHGELVRLGEGAEAHERGGHRDAAAEPGRRNSAAAPDDDHAAAHVEHRPLGLVDRLGGGADLPDVALDGGLVAGQVDRRRPAGSRCLAQLEGDGDVDEHRAGPAGGGDVEGLVDHPRQLGRRP